MSRGRVSPANFGPGQPPWPLTPDPRTEQGRSTASGRPPGHPGHPGPDGDVVASSGPRSRRDVGVAQNVNTDWRGHRDQEASSDITLQNSPSVTSQRRSTGTTGRAKSWEIKECAAVSESQADLTPKTLKVSVSVPDHCTKFSLAVAKCFIQVSRT